MSFSRKFLKYVLVGFVSAVVVLTGLVSIAADNLGTAYIQPRDLVYAGGSFRVLAENGFDQEQKQIIREASIRVRERMASQRSTILACANKRANRDKQSSSGKAINDQIDQVFFKTASGGRTINLSVVRLWSDNRFVGLAPVGTRDYQFPEKGNLLRIALNSDDLGSKSPYFLRNDIDYWAGVITHEILHNLGYNHLNGYEGSFVKEFDRCTRYSGNVPADFNLTSSQEKEA
jgi:hypothetical protein